MKNMMLNYSAKKQVESIFRQFLGIRGRTANQQVIPWPLNPSIGKFKFLSTKLDYKAKNVYEINIYLQGPFKQGKWKKNNQEE